MAPVALKARNPLSSPLLLGFIVTAELKNFTATPVQKHRAKKPLMLENQF